MTRPQAPQQTAGGARAQCWAEGTGLES